jgi:hypothetical protein
MSAPSIPKPPPAPPPPPTVDQAAQQADKANALRKRQGAAATLLSGPSGTALAPASASAALLGRG